MKKALAFAVTFLVVLSLSVFAQIGTEGSILGLVRDTSGAIVASASVTVTNTETGAKNVVATNESGYFQVLALPRGIYSVEVSAPGFKTWQIQSVELTVGEQKRVQPTLAVGDVQQQVTVEAGVEMVQTERASVEMAIEQKQIRELPLNGRIAAQLVSLTPGMRFLGLTQANVGGVQVQGLGAHSDATQFSVDGLSANDPSTEAGMAFPNLDSISEFRVQTNNFSAENGRDPLQVTMITKSGTNRYHGTLWEFLRNDKLDAANALTNSKPYLRRNQYGFSAGGPVIKNRTFFFVSYEGLNIRGQGLYNSPTVPAAFLQGDFSSLLPKTAIIDPLTGKAFANNQIPTTRFSSASKFFFPYILQPNVTGNFFRGLAAQPEDGSNFVMRIDQQLTSKQRIYGRWIRIGDGQTNTGYRPDVVSSTQLTQHNASLNYDYTITPWMLFNISAGLVHSNYAGTSPLVGKDNLTADAGIQGLGTQFRSEAIGLPTVSFSGYTGFSWPVQVPSSFKREVLNGRSSLNIIRGKHTLVVGGEYLDNRTDVHHSSTNPRGAFTFNSQYTGNSFADYLLGLVQTASANATLAAFGIAHSPYSAMYADDTWHVHPNLTLNAGIRWDYWWDKAFIRGVGTTFDFKTGKSVAGENSQGQVDLTAQPISASFAAATQGLWETASDAHMDPGLFQPSGYVSPRLGVAWRPFGKDNLVVRGGYGIFAASYYGNATGSSVIGAPYWATQTITFAKASNQRWETAFPANPGDFVAPSIASAVYDIKPMKIHEFNVSVEKTIPWLQAAATVAYVGSRGYDLTYFPKVNTAPPGKYTNLQAALPYPAFGTINLYESGGQDWYNGLQAKLEKRYSHGLTYLFSYAFTRDISLYGNDTTTVPTLYAPPRYDEGTSPNERRHILSMSGIYELPVGHGQRFGSNLPRFVNAAIGGWQLSGLYSFVSGAPLTPVWTGATLGNGVNARPDIAGDPQLSSPTHAMWYNVNAFTKPASYVFGNSAPGSIVGPATHSLATGLMKNFYFAEQRYVQFRWEMFNALNEVNLGNPSVTLGTPTAGQITSSGEARQMQFGLKVVF